jgi:hypothetical protein
MATAAPFAVRAEGRNGLVRPLRYPDFPSYWRARRGDGQTLVSIQRELHRSSTWVRDAMLAVEGRRCLSPEERAQASHGAAQGAEARSRAEVAAGRLGFTTVAAYLRERQGWPQARIRHELGVGERVLRILIRESGTGEGSAR